MKLDNRETMLIVMACEMKADYFRTMPAIEQKYFGLKRVEDVILEYQTLIDKLKSKG